MKWPLLKPKNSQNNTSPDQAEQDAFSSPNLLSTELFQQGSMSPAERNLILLSKITVVVILVGFFITLLVYFLNANSYKNRIERLNAQAPELTLYKPTEKRILNLQKKIILHKKVAPERKNFVDKVSATLAEIKTDENLREFTYSNGKLQIKIMRKDILDTTQLISALLEKEYISEIAILSADLNTAEEVYTIRLEIAYK